MASGLPVIATRVGAVPDVVLHGETGLLVEAGRPDFLAAAITQLASNPAQRAAFGQAGQQHLARAFSSQRMAGEYMHVYERALTLRGSRKPLATPVQNHHA